MRDAAGAVVRSLSGSGDHLVSVFTLSVDPYDPYQGNLLLRDAAWSMAFDGLDSSGLILPNGVYQLELSSVQGGSTAVAVKLLRIVSSGKAPPKAAVVPSLVLPGTTQATIFWAPAVAAEVRVYNQVAELLRVYAVGAGAGRVNWDLKTQGGQVAAAGVYLVAIRELGAKKPTVVKVFLKR